MKYKHLVPSLFFTGAILALLTTPALSQEKSSITADKSTASTKTPTNSTQQARRVSNSQFVKPITEIRSLSEIERPVRSARMLVQSPTPQATPSNEVIQVTGVKANPTDKGVEVILQTTKGQALQLVNRSTGNTFIADIPNAQLRLPSGDGFTFRSEKPIAGITEITVTNFDAKTIRVTVTGQAGAPIVELYDSPKEGLIFSVASTAPSAQQGQQPQTQQPGAQQPETQTQPTQPRASGDEPIELVVTGQQDGYNAPNASTATKTDTDRRDIPQATQVVPKQVIQDQRATRLIDVVKNVPGVSQGNLSPRFTSDTFTIRGFDASNNILVDGLPKRTTTSALGFNPATVERVEVLKGPASVLYGQGSLGGSINFITKQPLQQPYYSVEASAGSFNFYQGAIDLSGSLNDQKTVSYRFNAAAETTESFVDFYEQQRYIVSPVVTWQIGERTKLTLQAEYQQALALFDVGIPAEGTVLPNPNGKIPRNRFIGEPAIDNSNGRQFWIGYNFEHRFSENWQIRSVFQTLFSYSDRDTIFPSALANNKRTLTRSLQNQYIDQETYNLDTYTVGKFSTGSIRHQLVTGFNLYKYNLFSTNFFRNIASLDLFNPVYGASATGSRFNLSKFENGVEALGLYVQDQITLAENLKLLLGGRFDIVGLTFENFYNASRNSSQQSEAFSPRVGIVYQPIPAISLYASYGRSFDPTAAYTSASPPQPQRGTQYEVGIKADLSNRLSTTLAFYELTRTNVPATDPNNSLLIIQVGEQRSRGIEFDVTGEIFPGWNIIAGYAYNDAVITKDITFPVGNQLNVIPKHSFNLWTTYEIQSGSLQGLGFGWGFFFVGDKQGDLANTFALPSYFRTDAAIFYKRDNFRAALNFKNLFDVDYFETATSRVRVFYGDPFTVQGTISWEF